MRETYIDEAPASVTVKSTYQVGIGHHRCHLCRAWTPNPSEQTLEAFVRRTDGRDHYIWPFDDWWPEGWIHIDAGPAGVSFRLCAKCADDVVYTKVRT